MKGYSVLKFNAGIALYVTLGLYNFARSINEPTDVTSYSNGRHRGIEEMMKIIVIVYITIGRFQ